METAMSDQFSAWQLILSGDPTLLAIVRLSLAVSLSAVALAALAGMPLGALLALTRFPGRSALVVLLNALMGLPPVVVGLAVYLLLSRSGPLGAMGILFTPTAMVIAQTILIVPIIAALTRQTVEDLWVEYRDELSAMDVSPAGRMTTLLWDARFSLLTALLAGFGRAAAEVGAVMIVGGNIDGVTRVITTTIGLPASPPIVTFGSSGISPRNGTPSCSAVRLPPPCLKISSRCPQLGQRKGRRAVPTGTVVVSSGFRQT
jgi:tungstate transport system permease protein